VTHASPRKPKKRTPARRRPRRRSPAAARTWRWVAPLAVVLMVAGIGALVWSRSAGGRAALLRIGAVKLYPEVQESVGAALATVLPSYTAGPALLVADQTAAAYDWPLPRVAPGAAIRCRLVPVPVGQTYWELQHQVADAVATAGGRVLWGERTTRAAGGASDGRSDPVGDILRLDLGVTARPTHTLLLYHVDGGTPSVRWGAGAASTLWAQLATGTTVATIALVIDDWGYFQSEVTRGLLMLPVPLTLSILPGEPYSRRFALEATELALPTADFKGDGHRDRGSGPRALRLALGCPVEWHLIGSKARLSPRRREVLLHLPMEPRGYPEVNPGPDPVTVGMNESQVAALVDRALTALPTVRGVNNHMGSRATTDRATMRILMAVLAERGLYFVDSMTATESVGYREAVRAGLAAERNRIFLDANHDDAAEVRRNLGQLVSAARSGGFALGIGHPHAETLQVLRAEIPRLIAAGVRFVTVSELIALRRAARQDG